MLTSLKVPLCISQYVVVVDVCLDFCVRNLKGSMQHYKQIPCKLYVKLSSTKAIRRNACTGLLMLLPLPVR